MLRSHTQEQLEPTLENEARDITLIRWEHSGALELLSCNDLIEFDGESYQAGGVSSPPEIVDRREATIVMPATPDRVQESEQGVWREGICEIWKIPAAPGDEFQYPLERGKLQLKGVIDTSEAVDGVLTVRAVHQDLGASQSPRVTINQVLDQVLVEGTIIIDGTSTLALQSVRVGLQTLEKSTSNVFDLRGDLTAKQIESFREDAKELRLNGAGSGAHLSINYGDLAVPGQIARFWVSGANTVFLVTWGISEISQFHKILIKDADPASTVEIRNYRGSVIQAVDQSIVALEPAFDRNLVYVSAAGQAGVQYSLITMPTADVDSSLTFQALMDGLLVKDIDEVATHNGDPFRDQVGVETDFSGTNGATTATDTGPVGHTLTFNGTAEIQSNELDVDGSGHVSIADHASLRYGSASLTIELRFTPRSVSVNNELYERDGSFGDRGIRLRQINDDLHLMISSDGENYDIANEYVKYGAFLTPAVEYEVTLERDAGCKMYYVTVNGETVWQTYSELDPHENGEAHRIGDGADATFNCFKITAGAIRYGFDHDIAAAPFSDSATWVPGRKFSKIGNLHLADFFENKVYGGCVSVVEGEQASADWGKSLLDGVQARGELALRIAQPRRTAEHADYLVEYLDMFWIEEADGVALIPNRPVTIDNPSGQELIDEAEFNNAGFWTGPAEWTLDTVAGTVSCDGTQTGESIFVGILGGADPGEQCAVALVVDSISAGQVRVLMNAGEAVYPLDWQSTAGTHRAEFVPQTAAYFVGIVADADFVGTISMLSCRRFFWLSEGAVDRPPAIYPQKNTDTPSEVSVYYRVPDTDSANWQDSDPVVAALPGVDSGDLPLRPSAVYMRGYNTLEQATNYAYARLYRNRNRTRITWLERDFALFFQPGTVVRKRDTLNGNDGVYRVMQTRNVRQGRYECAGRNYSLEHWPSEQGIVVSGYKIPVDGILISTDGTIPAGYADAALTLDRFIRLTITDAEIGTLVGSATFAGFTDPTQEGGQHNANSGQKFWLQCFDEEGGAGSGDLIDPDDDEEFKGGHQHNLSTGVITPNLRRREAVFIRKTGTPSTTIPANVGIFGAGGLAVPNLVRDTTHQDRLLMTGAANQSEGYSYDTINITVDNADDRHEHLGRTPTTEGGPNGIFFAPPHYDTYLEGGSIHGHDADLRVQCYPNKILLAFYQAIADAELDDELYILWDQPLANQTDPDWILCDGTLGTPAVHGRIIEISKNGSEGGVGTGGDVIRLSGQTDFSSYHDHEDDYDPTTTSNNVIEIPHINGIRHRHTIDQTESYTPASLRLALFMAKRNPVVSFIDRRLLLSGGGADGATTIVDSSVYGLVPTVAGSPEYDDAQQLFSATSILFASGDRLHYPSFPFGRKFTIEGFFRLDSNVTGTLFSNGVGTEDFAVIYSASNGVSLWIDGALKDITSDPGVGAWFYVALVYDGAEWRFYYGLQSTGTAGLQHTEADVVLEHDDDLYIGNNVSTAQHFPGHLSELRVTRGAAIYEGSAITIPVAAFPTS